MPARLILGTPAIAGYVWVPRICRRRRSDVLWVQPAGCVSANARLVVKILKGDRPGELPFELPARYELIVNLKTAKAIGLMIPDSFVLLADEVIE